MAASNFLPMGRYWGYYRHLTIMNQVLETAYRFVICLSLFADASVVYRSTGRIETYQTMRYKKEPDAKKQYCVEQYAYICISFYKGQTVWCHVTLIRWTVNLCSFILTCYFSSKALLFMMIGRKLKKMFKDNEKGNIRLESTVMCVMNQ